MTKTEVRITLREHVSLCIEQYFSDLDGECPFDLYNRTLQEVEKPLLEIVMKKTHGNQLQTARILGINRNTLRKKLKQYAIK